MDRATVWQPVELGFQASNDYRNAYTEVELVVTFRHDCGEQWEIPGFWAGGPMFKARFAPTRSGRWTWVARSVPADGGLAGEGALDAGVYAGANPLKRHGFIRVAPEGRHLIHDDGTPFFFLGDTVWSAGAKATPTEWDHHVTVRSRQGTTWRR